MNIVSHPGRGVLYLSHVTLIFLSLFQVVLLIDAAAGYLIHKSKGKVTITRG